MDSDVCMDLMLLNCQWAAMDRGENKFTFLILSIGEDQMNVIGTLGSRHGL